MTSFCLSLFVELSETSPNFAFASSKTLLQLLSFIGFSFELLFKF